MATFIDEREEELEEGEQYESIEEETEQEEEESAETSESEQEASDIPDKYQGKSIQEVVAMHQHAEQLIGKQGQEVGELRRIVDDFIASQNVKEQQQAHSALEEFDETAFFENPKDTIQKLLDNHPSVKQSQAIAAQLKQQEAIARLKATHPDFIDIAKDEKFLEWVGKSKVRTKLLAEADKNYDFDSADELLTLWKERQQLVSETLTVEKQQRKDQVKTASSGTSKGSGERASRKIYRRADIIDLMRKDPQRYEALMPEIRQAYAEGRVK